MSLALTRTASAPPRLRRWRAVGAARRAWRSATAPPAASSAEASVASRADAASVASPSLGDDASSSAASSTLTYVDTHCHLDLIFRKMNEPRPPGKKRRSDAPDAPDDATAARSPSPASASSWDFASWRESVRRLDHSRRAEFRGASLDACLTVACSARAFAYAEALISGVDAPPGVYAAFGCHPLSACEWFDPALDLPARARRLVEARGRVVAVGECGLDYHRPNRSSGDPPEHLSAEAKDVQRRAFVDQMALATELGAPLVVHTRDAEEDTLELMRAHLPRDAKVHVHCFTSSLELADALLAAFPNLCLGFTGACTFKNAEEIRAVVRATPLERILLETDGPYMAPEPHRGTVAHPGMVPHVAAKIAEVKGVDVAEVFEATREATRRTYGI